MSRLIEANSENFKRLTDSGIVLVDFWAPWCSPCRALAPVMEKVASDNEDVTVIKVNIDESQGLSNKYNITGIPTVIIFKDGVEQFQFKGVKRPNYIQSLIESIK